MLSRPYFGVPLYVEVIIRYGMVKLLFPRIESDCMDGTPVRRPWHFVTILEFFSTVSRRSHENLTLLAWNIHKNKYHGKKSHRESRGIWLLYSRRKFSLWSKPCKTCVRLPWKSRLPRKVSWKSQGSSKWKTRLVMGLSYLKSYKTILMAGSNGNLTWTCNKNLTTDSYTRSWLLFNIHRIIMVLILTKVIPCLCSFVLMTAWFTK